MPVATLVTFGHEVHHVLVCRREGQVLRQHRLDVCSCDDLAIALVKEAEALFGLLIFAGLGSDSLVPAVSDNMLDEREIDSVTLEDLRITLFELLLDITRAHLVETEVLKNVTEEVVRNGELSLLKVMVEALLKIGSHLTWQVACGRTLWCLGDVQLCGFLGSGFALGGHF